jgi:4'-phosphopantetheinyl transferase
VTPLYLDDGLWLYRGIADDPDARARAVRRHLSEILGCGEGDIAIRRESMGKPVLTAPRDDIWFGTAGRDGLLVIALSRRGPVGVDVETLAHCRDGETIARTLFAPAESEGFARLPPAGRPLAFARLWTGKEAVLKATGRGVADGVARPDLAAAILPNHPPRSTMTVEMDGASHTLVWYTTFVDDAVVVIARAQSESRPSNG